MHQVCLTRREDESIETTVASYDTASSTWKICRGKVCSPTLEMMINLCAWSALLPRMSRDLLAVYAWIQGQVRLLKAMVDAVACMPFGQAQNGSRTVRRCAPMALHRGYR